MKLIYKPRFHKRRKPNVEKILETIDLVQRHRQGGQNQALFGSRLFSKKPFKDHDNANDRTILC